MKELCPSCNGTFIAIWRDNISYLTASPTLHYHHKKQFSLKLFHRIMYRTTDIVQWIFRCIFLKTVPIFVSIIPTTLTKKKLKARGIYAGNTLTTSKGSVDFFLCAWIKHRFLISNGPYRGRVMKTRLWPTAMRTRSCGPIRTLYFYYLYIHLFYLFIFTIRFSQVVKGNLDLLKWYFKFGCDKVVQRIRRFDLWWKINYKFVQL